MGDVDHYDEKQNSVIERYCVCACAHVQARL